MPIIQAITLGQDGSAQWVQLASGERFNMGSVSVLNFVRKLVGSAAAAKLTLDQFNKHGKAVVSVDVERMWELFPYRRSRWASDGSFMSGDHRTGPYLTKGETMPTILDDLKVLEGHIANLNKLAVEGKQASSETLEAILKLAKEIKSPNQSNNSTYYGYGTDLYEVGDTAPKPYTVGDAAPKPYTVGSTSIEGLSYDTFQANSKIASIVLSQAETTVGAIDRLASAGKRFNSVRAKSDVLAVISKTAGILKDVDLTQPWVRADLDKLASRMGEIHGLFPTE